MSNNRDSRYIRQNTDIAKRTNKLTITVGAVDRTHNTNEENQDGYRSEPNN